MSRGNLLDSLRKCSHLKKAMSHHHHQEDKHRHDDHHGDKPLTLREFKILMAATIDDVKQGLIALSTSDANIITAVGELKAKLHTATDQIAALQAQIAAGGVASADDLDAILATVTQLTTATNAAIAV
jgi:hypothetical protein